MILDPRTPVLVGAGRVSQRNSDPSEGAEAAGLMTAAVEAALEDSGSGKLRGRVGLVAAMASTTPYRDPARLVADGIGAVEARTWVAEPGVLQQHVISAAARTVAAGGAEAVVLVGGEAKYRAQQSAIGGVEVFDTAQAETVEPDERLVADGMVIHRCEIDAGLVQAVHHYAMIENRLGYERGLTRSENSTEVADLWARFSRIAERNPDAWTRTPSTPEEIATPSGSNRMLATPYTKLHNSQWNVDQAAALVLTTVGTADAVGVPRDRWVFPRGAAESNHMVPLVERAAVARCQGFEAVGEALVDLTGLALGSIDHVELYSCFPVAVRLQAIELGLDPERALTVTGGMTFAGGPFNHFVFQALVKLVAVLRDDPGAAGLITSVSGMLTKQAGSIWSTAPSPSPPRFLDVSDRTGSVTPVRKVAPGYVGSAQVVTSTVVWGRGGPEKAVAVVETPQAGRLLATSEDPEVLAAFESLPCIGEWVEVAAVSADSGHATLRLG